MALISLQTEPSTRQLRQFAAIWFPAFWLIVGWLAWKATGSVGVAATIWSTAALVSIVGFLAPGLMRYVFVAWMCAAYPIGWIIAHVLLAVIYYCVLTPIGLILRATGRDPMQRSFDRGASTYWHPHRADEGVSRYFRQN